MIPTDELVERFYSKLEREVSVMSFSSENHDIIEPLLAYIFTDIYFSDIQERAPYLSYLSAKNPFALTYKGFEEYQELIRTVSSLQKISQYWSMQSIKEKVGDLIRQLAIQKDKNTDDLDFKQIGADWLESFDIDFEDQRCYLPVIGLAVDKQLQIGDVTFLPLETDIYPSDDPIANISEKLDSYNSCFVHKTAKAEWIKAAEILRERAEMALNILRFFGSLVWWNHPTRHIYLAGKEPARVSYSLVIGPDERYGRMGHSEYTPISFHIDDEFLNLANHYGLNYVQSILKNTPTPLEQDFLTALQ
ncbi:MAG: hypothetical protein H8D23_37175 [Candidatus Brocadiales bacterium]|nr:hypothetical protein [Candidatus Brocadiales bacterium]